MKNQFFYTVRQTINSATPEGESTGTKEVLFKASFNLEKVIRSLELPSGELVVILDDFHTEMRQTVGKNANGKDILKVEPTTLQSEIIMSSEDKERFIALTNVESWKLEKC